ncbi:hypothetical protein CAPTEDRAFT_205023 [Capitella teleta]|uniref:Uncharacterized protein n=1 Tax=Capitella teleta TaxID=283909 RepID=R7T3H6_CAPTE|nr:hypothetical protein CAPTEDRAFT_205023 [Capitella teleta]|eukprot:ELT87146.1 hypothetical protein CAPTEDRAFT_205023 [Capitella teleta]
MCTLMRDLEKPVYYAMHCLFHKSIKIVEDLKRQTTDEVSEDEMDRKVIKPLPPVNPQDIYNAVRTGNIEELDDLLDLPKADINTSWDKNEDYLSRDRESAELDYYTAPCRQMAYDRHMLDIVYLIDEKNGNFFSYKPRKKPMEEKIREKEAKERLDRERLERELRSIRRLGSMESRRGSKVMDSRRSLRATTIATEVTRVKVKAWPTSATSRAKSAEDKRAKAAPSRPTTPGYVSADFMDKRELSDIKQTPKYRNTRSYHARKMSSRERMESPQREHLPRASPQVKTSIQDYSAEMQGLNKSRVMSAQRDITRVVSPWKQDDPKYVANLRCRSARCVQMKHPMRGFATEVTNHLPCLDQVKRTKSTLLHTHRNKRHIHNHFVDCQ